MNSTPNANRLHISIFGKRNSGKSTLMNAITGQNISIVSPMPGTTTDPVYRPIELKPLGACVFIDTAGFDDTDAIGNLRVLQTEKILLKTDIAILIFSEGDFSYEKSWIEKFKKHKIPYISVVNTYNNKNTYLDGISPLVIDVKKESKKIIGELIKALPQDFEMDGIVSHLIKKDDIVMLVMPQDASAPKGRLILPQVQTIRELLDNKCTVICTTDENFAYALDGLKNPPKLIITDSQVFKTVYDNKPKNSLITSFSVLFARFKGDIKEFVKGAAAIDGLKESDSVLIAEACTHAPESEDIGRIKIPAMLRKKAGENLKIDVVSGSDFPENLSKYALIIHCGGCMFNRKYILSRIEKARLKNIPITNYGITIAKLTGILNYISI